DAFPYGRVLGETGERGGPEDPVPRPDLEHTKRRALGDRRQDRAHAFPHGAPEERARVGRSVVVSLRPERRTLARVEPDALAVEGDLHEPAERDEPVRVRGASQEDLDPFATSRVLVRRR